MPSVRHWPCTPAKACHRLWAAWLRTGGLRGACLVLVTSVWRSACAGEIRFGVKLVPCMHQWSRTRRLLGWNNITLNATTAAETCKRAQRGPGFQRKEKGKLKREGGKRKGRGTRADGAPGASGLNWALLKGTMVQTRQR